jgi:hypothetical protein
VARSRNHTDKWTLVTLVKMVTAVSSGNINRGIISNHGTKVSTLNVGSLVTLLTEAAKLTL